MSCIQIIINLIKLQSTPVNSYPDKSNLRLIRMYLRPPFRYDQRNIIRFIRIAHYSYYFIRALTMGSRRIQLYLMIKISQNELLCGVVQLFDSRITSF